MKNKGKTWSRGTNSRLPFGVNLNLNLSIDGKQLVCRATAVKPRGCDCILVVDCISVLKKVRKNEICEENFPSTAECCWVNIGLLLVCLSFLPLHRGLQNNDLS